MKLDIFNHIFPKRYYERMLEVAPNGRDMHKRVRAIPSIVDLDARFRIMDMFGDYAQVICLGAPPIEVFGPPPVSTDLARLANDGMAELVARHPDRFPAFIASLPMNDPDGLLVAQFLDQRLLVLGVQVCKDLAGIVPRQEPERDRRLVAPSEIQQPLTANRQQQMIMTQLGIAIERSDRRQCVGGTVDFCDRDRAIQRHDGRCVEGEELIVELEDQRPVDRS